jgi:hypothetical protein
MKRSHKFDPAGRDYWTLTYDQRAILGALTTEFQTLRRVLSKAGKDCAGSVTAHARWEKLAILGALEVHPTERNDVLVRRGPSWHVHWNVNGIPITEEEMLQHEILESLGSNALDFSRI